MPLKIISTADVPADFVHTITTAAVDAGLVIGVKKAMSSKTPLAVPKYFTPIRTLNGQPLTITVSKEEFALTPEFGSFGNKLHSKTELDFIFENHPKLAALHTNFLSSVAFPKEIKFVVKPLKDPPFTQETKLSEIDLTLTGIYEDEKGSRYCLRYNAE